MNRSTSSSAVGKTSFLARWFRFSLALSLLGFTSLSAKAEDLSTIHLGTSAYSTLYSGNYANNTNGGGPTFFVGGGPSASVPVTGWYDRSLILFDIASLIPEGSTIIDVKLTLTLAFPAGSSGGTPGTGDQTPRTISLFRLTSDWGQDTVSFSEKTSGGGTGGGTLPNPALHGATWNEAFYGQTAWETEGGGGDFVDTASASLAVDSNLNSPYTWGSTEALIADVQGWLDGTIANNGWILISADEEVNQSFRTFWSSEGAERQVALGNTSAASWAPDLEITYSTAVPEPAASAMLLAGIGGLALLRRFRRKA